MGSLTLRRILGAILLIAVLFTVLPSLVGRLVLQAQLRELGASRVDVRVFHLNLWTGRFTLKGLRADTPGRPLLVIDELIADVAYLDAAARQIHLTDLTLSGVQLPLREQQGGWQLGPLDLPLPENDDQPSDEPTAAPIAWRWGLSNLSFSDVDLSLHYQDMTHTLRLDKLELPSLLQWAPEELTKVNLLGELNGRLITIDSDTKPLADIPTATIHIRIDALPLGPLVALWQPEQQATLSSDLHLSLAYQGGKQLSVDTRGEFILEQVNVNQPGIKLQLPHGQWQGNSRLQLDDNGLKAVNAEGRLQLRELAILLAQADESAPPLTLNNSVDLSIDLAVTASAGALSLSQDSELTLSDITFNLGELATTADQIQWRGQTQQQVDEQGLRSVNSHGALSIDQLSLSQGKLSVTQQAMTLDGQLDTDITKTLTFTGGLRLKQLGLRQPPYQINVTQQQWQGTALAALDSPGLRQLGGDFDLQGVDLEVTQTPSRLQLKRLQLSDFTLDSDYQLQASQLQLNALQLEHDAPLLKLEQLQLAGVDAGAKRTALGRLEMGAVNLQVLLNSDKQPYLWQRWIAQVSGTDAAASGAPTTSTPTPAAGGDEAAYPFSMDRFELTAPLVVQVNDERIEARRPLQLSLSRMTLGKLDTRSDAITPFQFEARLNRFGSLKGEGNYSLFSQQANGVWNIDLDQLELPPFSPYMNLHTGYQVSSGQMHLTTNGTLKNNIVDSQNRLVLNRFEVEQGDPDAAGEFTGQLGMPLELAVSILTDEDDNVTLDIPVSGSLNDPEFGVQSVVNILLAKVAKEGAMGYLSFALQPYGALLSLGRMAMDAAEGASIQLDPVAFAPGEGQLDDTGRDYLGKLSGLLANRKGLKLKLCGTSVAADNRFITDMADAVAKARGVTVQQVLTEPQRQSWLYNLAELRGEQVKAHLTDEREVDGKRLFSCLPQVDSESADTPRVRIGL